MKDFILNYLNTLLVLLQDIWSVIPYILFILIVLIAAYVMILLREITKQNKLVLSSSDFNQNVEKHYRSYVNEFKTEMEKVTKTNKVYHSKLNEKIEDIELSLSKYSELSKEINSGHIAYIKELEGEIIKLKKINDKLRKKINKNEKGDGLE